MESHQQSLFPAFFRFPGSSGDQSLTSHEVVNHGSYGNHAIVDVARPVVILATSKFMTHHEHDAISLLLSSSE
jgi:hypothetical protein